MNDLAGYFAMGGYARFIWPAYGLVALVMIGLVVATLRGVVARERELAVLQERRPGRRRTMAGAPPSSDRSRS